MPHWDDAAGRWVEAMPMRGAMAGWPTEPDDERRAGVPSSLAGPREALIAAEVVRAFAANPAALAIFAARLGAGVRELLHEALSDADMGAV